MIRSIPSPTDTVSSRVVHRHMKATASLARAGLLFLCLSMSAFASGGLDVELLDAGTVLHDSLVCMPPADAQRLDFGLRTAESERDQYRTALAITLPVAVAAIVAMGVAWAMKK